MLASNVVLAESSYYVSLAVAFVLGMAIARSFVRPERGGGTRRRRRRR
jgi:hypothetical protein